MSSIGPNLFEFATSELSQDAFLSWLLSWADGDFERADPELHRVARRFVETLLPEALDNPPSRSYTVKVDRQVKGADVVARIGDEIVFVIEDKVHTSEHSNQLARYKRDIEELYPESHCVFVYLKTGDQSNLKNIKADGWVVFPRSAFLEVLKEGEETVQNAIFRDYLAHLEAIERAVNAYEALRVKDWDNQAWTGFFSRVQEELGEGRWGKVNNPGGGFMAFWWGWQDFARFSLYLQLDRATLTVRVWTDPRTVADSGERKEIRDTWAARISESLRGFNRPKRLGLGQTMKVAEFDGCYMLKADGHIDFDATVEFLRDLTRRLADFTSKRAMATA